MRRKIVMGTVAITALAGVAFAAANGGIGNGGKPLIQLAAQSADTASGQSDLVVPAAEPKAGDKVANSYICVFRNAMVQRGNERAEAVRAARAAGGNIAYVYENTVRGFAVNASAQGVENMRRGNAAIAYCEQDQIATIIDPVNSLAKPGGGGGTAPAQVTPYGITRVGGGLAGTYRTAWVLDTGIDLDHPDLNVDVPRSRNFVSRETSPEDLNGHGTHVAGTIAALNNSIGVIGVAPGAPVVAIRVLNRRGSGSYADIIAAVDYVGANAAAGDVANMSLGGGASQALDDAVVAAAGRGIIFSLAAGNESTSATTKSPARANGANVYTVSAINSSDVFASFSNFGNPPIDWAAPGVGVQSTWLSGGYNTISGTSMAAPHVAGLYLLGAVRADGLAINDPDGNRDPIARH